MVHIPYRGAGPAINDVLAGQVAVYFDQVASSLPHIKSGKLKAMAVSWPARLDVLPDVPTYAELGYKQAERTLVVWRWRRRRHTCRCRGPHPASGGPGHQGTGRGQRLAGQGLYPSGTSAKDFTAQIAREIEKMKRVAEFARVSWIHAPPQKPLHSRGHKPAYRGAFRAPCRSGGKALLLTEPCLRTSLELLPPPIPQAQPGVTGSPGRTLPAAPEPTSAMVSTVSGTTPLVFRLPAQRYALPGRLPLRLRPAHPAPR